MLDKIRSLRGQVIATTMLFVGCLPISIGIVIARPYFEQHFREVYTADYSQFLPQLKSLVDSLEGDHQDGKSLTLPQIQDRNDALRQLTPEYKRRIYEDWIQRATTARSRTAKALTEIDADLFLGWAEQTVVCGNTAQRHRALSFLEYADCADATDRLKRLEVWARRRKWDEIAHEIAASLTRISLSM